jgi:putative tributyrin esterase
MPLIHCNFYSQTLQLSTSMDVILPLRAWQAQAAADPIRHPTLYLLHGLSDDHTIWQRRTSIERYVENRDLAVVMPAVQRSFYTNMKAGLPYWTFVSEELPYVARSLFPLSAAREQNFVAGLSMGGYGAFKLAFSHPERFAAAASFSGAVDMRDAWHHHPDPTWRTEMDHIFGSRKELVKGPNDLFWLAEQAAATPAGKSLRLYQWCGTEDFLHAANVSFHQHAQKLGLDLTYAEGPGDHQWKYWDEQIQIFLEMIQPAAPSEAV